MPSTRRLGGGLLVPEQTAPGTPASGYMEIYGKSDGILYYKNDAGTEVALTAAGSPTYPLLAPNGLVTAPSYSFTNDSDTGMFLNAVGELRLAVGAQRVAQFIDDGSYGEATLYARGSGVIGFTHGGAQLMYMNSTAFTSLIAIHVPRTRYSEGTAPATPAAGNVVTYAKADGLMYSKDDAGVETPMSVDTDNIEFLALMGGL